MYPYTGVNLSRGKMSASTPWNCARRVSGESKWHRKRMSKLEFQPGLKFRFDYMGFFQIFQPGQTKNHSPVWKNRSRGLFLERPGKLSGAESHPLSRRKPFWVFLAAPVIFDPVIIPISNIPGNYRESLPGASRNTTSGPIKFPDNGPDKLLGPITYRVFRETGPRTSTRAQNRAPGWILLHLISN